MIGIESLSFVARNSRKMGALIDDILKLSYLGRKEMTNTEFDMNFLEFSVIDELNIDGTVKVG